MKIIKPFIETSCHKCGSCNEAKFYISGPHLKQVCIDCGAYIKFFDKSLVPDVTEIKQKIFYMMDGDLNLIEKGKIDCEFIPNLTGLTNKLMYWKLYLQLRKDHAL